MATATATPKQEAIPTPDAQVSTATPEAPKQEVNMTLEDWKNVFSGPYTSEGEAVRDLSIMVDGTYGTVLTDPDEIEKLDPNAPFAILGLGGEIFIFKAKNPTEAADMVRQKEGTVVLTTDSDYPDTLSKLCLLAANQAYKNGNKNISVVFDGSDDAGDPEFKLLVDIEKYILVEKDENGNCSAKNG
ncbi:MAG: hypothetical protein M3R47_00085 [Chloroflexota bacterium]|nr:hypothetical protein [Chloroflexota bacterium]